jgi:hypothetical protein
LKVVIIIYIRKSHDVVTVAPARVQSP